MLSPDWFFYAIQKQFLLVSPFLLVSLERHKFIVRRHVRLQYKRQKQPNFSEDKLETDQMKKLQTILLVDDDKVNNFLNKTLLEELGIAQQITVVTNGLLALHYLQDHCHSKQLQGCPSLVIFDHQMPVMDGMELIQALHKINFIIEQKIIFILLGIHTLQPEIEAFQRLGVQEFTTKPLSKEIVLEVYHKYWSQDTKADQASFN